MNAIFLPLFAFAGCVGTVLAQGGELARSVLSDSVGLHSGALGVFDGVVCGGGGGYRVRFDQESVEFVPAFGSRAKQLHPVTFRLVSVRREQGGDPISAVMPKREVGERSVVYQRPGYVETYDVLATGIEQSFTFESLPPGEGDLIVRGTLDTDLEVSPAEDGGLRLVLDGIGELSIGGVTGIDAEGGSVAGSLRYEHHTIELVLPGEFVDAAALPLVVDPLIGGVITVEATTNDDGGGASVAFDASAQVYCVVWEEVFTASQADVRARRISAGGMPLGSEWLVTNTPSNARDPEVASCNERGRFVIVWEDNRSGNVAIWGRSMNASTGALGSQAELRGGASQNRSPDVGGSVAGDQVYVVYEDQTEDDIEGLPVTVTAAGNLVPGTAVNIQTASANYGPRISKSAGPGGRHLVVWMREAGGDFTNIEGRLVGASGGFESAIRDIATSSADEDDPDVDGDGNSWVVAYEVEAIPLSANNDIVSRSVLWSAGGVDVGFPVTVESGPEEEINPSVAWCGGSVLIAFDDDTVAPDADVYLAVLDPFTCQPLQAQVELRLSGSIDSTGTAIASEFSGNGDTASSEAFIAWEDVAAPDTGTIVGRRFRSDDGLVTELGGGCGIDARSHATGAIVGNADFHHRLRHGAAGPPSSAALLLSFGRLDAPCGTCTIVPDPFTGIAIVRPVNCLGDASVAMSIPNDPGLRGLVFYDQWLTLRPLLSSSCLPLSADLSTAIAVEIQ